MPDSSYDDIAEMYDLLWAGCYLPGALPALEGLFFAHLQPKARVLDVCCGSGHVTRELMARGYRVTGVDNSPSLIALAKRQLPGTDFRVEDARALAFANDYDAALSTFDSLNHILSLDQLHQVFSGVHGALVPGGLFVFDMNLEEAYSMDLHHWTVNNREAAVGLSRGLYDTATHTAHTELIWFTRGTGAETDCWRRRQSIVEERCYPKEDIVQALQFAGFRAIQSFHAVDLGVNNDLGFGRYFFSAQA